MSGAIVVYIVYVALAIALIAWLGVLLHRDGRIFLDDVFRDQTNLAAAVSQLLVTGFLVFTLGYALLLLRIDAGATPVVALRTSVQQFGLLLLSLGVLHSLNMMILLQARRRASNRRMAARGTNQRRRNRASDR
jgi:hypothetical protein